ncbi:unnamed protein product [Lampetra planeri]
MTSPSSPAVVHSAQGHYAQKLLNDLMENYSSALRPVEDTDRALNVTLQITLSQIKDMDERNQVLIAYLWIRQTWHDAYLKWNKEDYDGLDVIHIPSSLVWRPDLVLYNKADDDFSGPMDTNVRLRYDGEITWDAPAITKSSCVVDVSYFPFDSQEYLWSYTHLQHTFQVDIIMGLDSGDLSDFVENVEWECHGMPATKNVIMYGCCSDPYPDITYTVLLQRRSSFYIFNLLLPCFLISFLAPLGFYLPADSGEKVSLGVTVLLALTVFQLMVAESMPPSESVPLIVIAFLFSFYTDQDLLEDIMTGSCFYFIRHIPDGQKCLVAVMLYDFQDRNFLPRKWFGEDFIQEVRDVENYLIRFKTKLAASLARCRVKHNLSSIECFLPESVKVESIGQLEGQTFCQDPHCGDLLVFPARQKAELYSSTLLSEYKLIIQDKSCSSLAPNVLRQLLTDKGDVSYDMNLLQDLSQGSVAQGKLEALVEQQKKDINHALTFPKVSVVVYSTRSSHLEENEEVVSSALKQAEAELEQDGKKTKETS